MMKEEEYMALVAEHVSPSNSQIDCPKRSSLP